MLARATASAGRRTETQHTFVSNAGHKESATLRDQLVAALDAFAQ